MKKWLRRLLIAALLVALTFGVLYECATHVGRGWLRGEAFFEGRPTSYWRSRCDEYLQRFDDEESLKAVTWLLPYELAQEPGLRMFRALEEYNFEASHRLPRDTYLKRFKELLRSKEDLERDRSYVFAPKILWATPDAAPVLEELLEEKRYQLLATIGLRRIEYYKRSEAKYAKRLSEGLP